MHVPPETVARGSGVTGEVVLRRRTTPAGDVHELIVNGICLMDTAETSTERLLAESVLERHAAPRRVLVGGLGLGFTVAELLADPRVELVDVVEIEPLLSEWLREGLVPGVDHVLTDPRVSVVDDDVRAVLGAAPPGRYDGVLLDVDNGPDFLVRSENAALYERPALKEAESALGDGGVLAVWSAAPSSHLVDALTRTVGTVEELVRTVIREGRDVDYYAYLATRATP
ncbi:MAG: hypothetical protein ACRDVZ_06685 [Jiangellaceae bacterium]